MDSLEDLTLQKCCLCIELKIGCYIIAILSLIILVPGTSGAVESCYNEKSNTVKAIVGLGGFMFFLALFAGIFFLYGLTAEVSLPTRFYMVVLVVAMIFTFVTAVLFFNIKSPASTSFCPAPLILAGSAVIEIAVQFYCFVIVNSYRVLSE